jgi:hypothetical protein
MAKSICSGLVLSLIFVAVSTARADESEIPQVKSERSARNAIYIELGGNGAWYSLNYERFVMDDAALRVGGMFMSLSASASSGGTTSTASASWFAAPLMFSYLGVGSENHKLELGAGATVMYFSGSGTNNFSSSIKASGFVMAPTATVGYRYVPTDGGFNFKAGFTPFLIAAAGQTQFFPWAGIAAGYGF